MTNIVCLDCGHVHKCTEPTTVTTNSTKFTFTTDGTVDK